MQGKGTRLSVTTITLSAYSESASANPISPEADLPFTPLAFPNGSEVGAAITAISQYVLHHPVLTDNVRHASGGLPILSSYLHLYIYLKDHSYFLQYDE
jgi:hypothetical protein